MLYDFDETKDAIINAKDFIKKVDNIPEIAVACFSKDLFEKIVEGAKCTSIGELSNTNGKKYCMR